MPKSLSKKYPFCPKMLKIRIITIKNVDNKFQIVMQKAFFEESFCLV